jgi:hypothetical protein
MLEYTIIWHWFDRIRIGTGPTARPYGSPRYLEDKKEDASNCFICRNDLLDLLERRKKYDDISYRPRVIKSVCLERRRFEILHGRKILTLFHSNLERVVDFVLTRKHTLSSSCLTTGHNFIGIRKILSPGSRWKRGGNGVQVALTNALVCFGFEF